jgi:hypothetical protein
MMCEMQNVMLYESFLGEARQATLLLFTLFAIGDSLTLLQFQLALAIALRHDS